MIEDGIIEVDSAAGKCFGLTSDSWAGDTYLWKNGNKITCSFVWAKEPNKGHFRSLVNAIEAAGFIVAVPTPLYQMTEILKHWGWISVKEDSEMGAVEVWQRREPDALP